MKIKVELEQEKKIYGVLVNSDLNEGRGFNYVKHLCEKEATAIRLSKRADVQGSDGSVVELQAVKIYGKWFYEGALINKPTSEDDKLEIKLEHEREKKKLFNDALAKAKELGLSQEDIEALQGGK
ncbi:hypothetical protein PP410_gp38 [Vibrio phage NF]|uniref:Uncharacterized protein n=1 Tax=Vibrio phage NF TaxID=2686202 RepID=A0A6B9J1X6_9CAUD|nr:hypothetical protein PP410_gp38 [Vibrio phage NF]QGZ13255.1 hypothetical protein [Vibrio phage NF]